MLGITDLATYVVGVVVIVLLPGPNSLFVLSVASAGGPREGYKAAAGVFAGDTVLMLLTAAGVSSLLHAYAGLYLALRIVGAGYLAWMALGMLRALPQLLRGPEPGAVSVAGPQPELARPFTRALAISLLNPKAILFFLSFFIQFVDPDYAWPALSFLVLGAIVQLVSLSYLSALIFAGHRLAEAFRSRRLLAAAAQASVAGLFLMFSVKLATAA